MNTRKGLSGRRLLPAIWAVLLLSAAGLPGCGGGGGEASQPPPVNTPPVAVALAISTALLGSEITLDGTESRDAEGSTLSYAWTVAARPANSTAVPADATSAKARFTPDAAGGYTLRLVVSDGLASSQAATLTLSVTADAGSLEDGLAARAALLGSVVDLDADAMFLQWQDTFPAGTRYRIETLSSDGAYALAATVDGRGTVGASMQWRKANPSASTWRVLAERPGRAVPLLTAQGAGNVASGLPTPATGIVLERADLVGTVQLAVGGLPASTEVSWFVDLNLVGTGNPLAWNSRSVVNGGHQLLARWSTAPGSHAELRRTVSTNNPTITMSSNVFRNQDTVFMNLIPISPYVITGVSASFDGRPLGTLSAPNVCTLKFGCGGPTSFNGYQFTVSASAEGSGDHVLQVSVTDAGGGQLQQTVSVPISVAPVLTLESPVDGAILVSSLRVAGAVTSDTGSPVAVSASLGDLRLLDATGPGFSGTLDLTGVAAGSYTLTVRATDVRGAVTTLTRSVVVASSPSTQYTPLWTLGSAGKLLAAEDQRLLYQADDQTFRIRDTATGSDIMLDGAATLAATGRWHLSNGRVFVQGRGSDCVATCIYEWTADGLRRNLSNLNPHSVIPGTSTRTEDMAPVVRGGTVVWFNASGLQTAGGRSGHYTLYDMAQDRFTRITPPGATPGAGFLEFPYGSSYDLALTGPIVRFFHWSRAPGSSSGYDVYRWDSDTQSQTRLSTGSLQAVTYLLQTDGVRVAWSEGAAFSSVWRMVLRSQPVAGGTTGTTGTQVATFVLGAGKLAWLEQPNSSIRVVKVETPGGERTLSITPGAWLHPVQGGSHVIYTDAGKTYSWNPVTQTATLRLDEWVGSPLLSNNTLYFTLGSQQTVYKAVLD